MYVLRKPGNFFSHVFSSSSIFQNLNGKTFFLMNMSHDMTRQKSTQFCDFFCSFYLSVFLTGCDHVPIIRKEQVRIIMLDDPNFSLSPATFIS